MDNAERTGRNWPLAGLRRGASGTVAEVDPAWQALLAANGIHLGRRLAVESVAPLGGPVVVALAGARVALARAVARRVAVAVDPGMADPGTNDPDAVDPEAVDPGTAER